MSDLKYRLYGKLNAFLRSFKARKKNDDLIFFCAYQKSDLEVLRGVGCTVNGERLTDNNFDSIFFKGDNFVVLDKDSPKELKNELARRSGSCDSIRLDAARRSSARDRWLGAIENALVEDGWRNSGLYLCAYIKERKQWALSSWIWTSAALVRALELVGNTRLAQTAADAFLREQREEGSWIVRYSCLRDNLSRLTAPNDSAYVARSAMLPVYRATGDEKYLDSAVRCADWTMKTAFADGLVRFAYDIDQNRWLENSIVDVGFTADLFAELYRTTQDEKYKTFLAKFIKTYVETFYDRSAKFFSSSIGPDRSRRGGYFSRGQGWAMEGLSAAYDVLREQWIFDLMEELTSSVVGAQLKNGGWRGNFQKGRSLMGEDCKGIPVLAKNLLVWAHYSKNKERLIAAAKKAYEWCVKHTDPETGTIVSFTSNGAIEYSPNTSVGILYANAYAIEVEDALRKLGAL